MKIAEFMKRPVSRIEYYGPIAVGTIISGIYGVFYLRQMKKILKEKEVEPEEKEEDEA